VKAATQGLKDLLATGQFVMADLFTFTLINATVVRLTSGDADIVSGGQTFSAVGPRIERSRAHWKIGLDVDMQEIKMYPQSTDLIGGLTWPAAVCQGLLDGAIVQVERAFMPTYGDTSNGTVIMFAGRMATVDFARNGIVLRVNSHLELLNVTMPRNLYQPGCVHTLYDAGCTLVKATFTFTGTVGAGATKTSVPIAGTGHGDGYYDLGTLLFTSGVNNGVSRAVKQWLSNAALLQQPLYAVPGNGDVVQIAAGCDKLQATCTTKFNNLANFRGFPYVPVPETAV